MLTEPEKMAQCILTYTQTDGNQSINLLVQVVAGPPWLEIVFQGVPPHWKSTTGWEWGWGVGGR